MTPTVKELHKKRSKMWDASIGNHDKYLDKNTGLFSTRYTEERNCPVCDSSHDLKLFDKEGGTYVKCRDCMMIYLNPVFNDDALTDYYERNHTIQSEIVESDTDNFYVNIYNRGLESIIETTTDRASILDIGCSSGAFLDLAKKRGLQTYGLELNKAEYQIAKDKGHQVYNELLENVHYEEKLNAVSLWDVFEHIKDGEYYLNTIKKILSKNGIIFLQIPSSDALAAKILRERCNMFDGLEHVNLYGAETIRKLADKCHLEVVGMKTVISEIGVLNNYLNYEDPYLGNTTNKQYIPNIIDEAKLHKELLGYKLQVILKRKVEN